MATITKTSALTSITKTTAAPNATTDSNDVIIIANTSDLKVADTINGALGTDEIRVGGTNASAQTFTFGANVTGIESIVIGSGTGVSASTSGTAAHNVNASAVTTALSITGNAGNNGIIGTAQADTIDGGSGNDTITGGAGVDKINGSAGNDLFIIGKGSEHGAGETINGGADSDEVRFASTLAGDTLTLNLNDTGIEKVAIGTGTAAAAVTTATTALNVNAALFGADISITGNAGANRITGSSHNDTLTGGGGADLLVGGAGNDTYYYALTTENAAGEKIIDAAGTSDRVVFGGVGLLTLGSGVTGVESVAAGVLDASGALVSTGTVAGGVNAAAVVNSLTFTGNAGANTFVGTAFADTFTGGAGADSLVGGAGNDYFIVNSVAEYTGDKIDGGDGTSDRVIFNGTTGTLTLANLTNVERVYIDSTSDVGVNASALATGLSIYEGEGANTITGTKGNDTIVVRNADGYQDDTINGGTGYDILKLDAGLTDYVINANTTGIEEVLLDDDSEDSTLDASAYTANGLALTGNEYGNEFIGTELADAINAAGGDDTIFIQSFAAYVAGDVIDGGDGDDTVVYDLAEDVDVVDGSTLQVGLGMSNIEAIEITGDADITIDSTFVTDAVEISGNAGDNLFITSGHEAALYGGYGSDTFVILGDSVDGMEIDGGTELAGTDAVVAPVYYDAGHTKISTASTTLGTPNATDSILFTQSGDFSNIGFINIEQIHLADGVSITLSSAQLDEAGESLDLGSTNPGLHYYGMYGGEDETVTVVVDYADITFTPAVSVTGSSATTYTMGDFQLDDFSTGDIFHDVVAIYDAHTNGAEVTYTRIDGSNNDEIVYGSEGVDNATMRLGDDVYFGYGGNDLLVGHQGADYLDGGDGNDYFTITGFHTGFIGASSKADDGNAEWIATGTRHDLILGGNGIDTLRITAGADNTTDGLVVLNDANFQGMERVEVGATITRTNVEDSALQLLNDHFYFRASGSVASTVTGGVDGASSAAITQDNVIVDASGVTANGLIFVGNLNKNTFIGTTHDDTFIGNGGADTLTGRGQ